MNPFKLTILFFFELFLFIFLKFLNKEDLKTFKLFFIENEKIKKII
jgi:hypothetical protein